MNKQSIFIKLLKLNTTSPMLFRALMLLVCIELLAIFIAPLLISDNTYLKSYLSEAAKDATEQFLQGKGYLIPSQHTGWQNNKGLSIGHWEIDALGSRSHRKVGITPSKPIRTIFLGSSMINGGTSISNHETISAYLENNQIEALNFGTMLFSPDQSYDRLHELLFLKPNVVIIGLDSDPVSGLSNIYIPFRNKTEANVAFLKPRYLFKNDQFIRIDVTPEDLNQLRRGKYDMHFLEEYDDYYTRFKRYIRFGQTPLASIIGTALRKAESFAIYQSGQAENERILIELMNRTLTLSKKHGFKLLFLSTPALSDLKPSRLMQLFPDRYKNRIEQLRSMGHLIVDGADIFKLYHGDIADLYHEDRVHFKAEANQLIANHLRPIILNEGN